MMNHNGAAISVERLNIILGGRHILHDISFAIPNHEITALIGPNGCGKSTLLRSIIGHVKADSGNVLINGKVLGDYSQKELSTYMAFLPQVPDMPRDMTIEELVYCGRYPHQSWWKNTAREDRLAVDRALEITKTSHLRHQMMPSLSGGERQRVWIAMALAQEPQLLVLDEPTTYLDINHQLEIMELLKRLNREQHMTVLMVLHDLTQAAQYADYMAVIKEGHLVVDGVPQDIMTEQLLLDVFKVRAVIEDRTDKPYVKIQGLA